MKNIILMLFVIFALVSCENKNNCDDVACDSPIPFVALNLVEAESGENLFANETYKIEDVELVNENDQSVSVWLDSENNLELPLGSIEGKNEYRLYLSPEVEILFTIEFAAADDSCCSTPTLVSFNVLNYEFEQTSTRIYTIFIK